MTDRELMQMALDALDKYGFMPLEDEIGWQHFKKTIEALRARLDGFERVNMYDHKEGDLRIGTKPYAAQAAMVAQQTQGRMYVDPVTGDVGIGTVKWDASAPLVVHPHPAFQTTEPQSEWIGLTDEEVIKLGGLDKDSDYFGLWYDFARAIEAKLKEKNT